MDRKCMILFPLVLLICLDVCGESRGDGAAKNPDGSFTYTNRLAKEKSPYLLQHAHNPVDWYPWGGEAFDKAKKDGKPIFLSIGYSTCRWCHVMERESFEDPAVAKLINENFIAIKVDREERPDVDRVYMAFVQGKTGSGGWPMTVLLTPELKPFFGGTYFPPEDHDGLNQRFEVPSLICEICVICGRIHFLCSTFPRIFFRTGRAFPRTYSTEVAYPIE
jgi:hypothetical protein